MHKGEKQMTHAQFFQLIPSEYWEAASGFGFEPPSEQHRITLQTSDGFLRYDELTARTLEEAVLWMGKGTPEDQRWVVLELPYEEESKPFCCRFIQAGIFDDGKISCEYQMAVQTEFAWIAKNFWHDFDPCDLEQVLFLFDYCFRQGTFYMSMAGWHPQTIIDPSLRDELL